MTLTMLTSALSVKWSRPAKRCQKWPPCLEERKAPRGRAKKRDQHKFPSRSHVILNVMSRKLRVKPPFMSVASRLLKRGCVMLRSQRPSLKRPTHVSGPTHRLRLPYCPFAQLLQSQLSLGHLRRHRVAHEVALPASDLHLDS